MDIHILIVYLKASTVRNWLDQGHTRRRDPLPALVLRQHIYTPGFGGGVQLLRRLHEEDFGEGIGQHAAGGQHGHRSPVRWRIAGVRVQDVVVQMVRAEGGVGI